MPKPKDISSPAYHGAQALRAAAADAYDETRDWLLKRANTIHPESDPEGVELVRRIHAAVDGDPVAMEARTVAHILTREQFTFANEAQLQAAILDALDKGDVKAIREVKLNDDNGRIDLLTKESVGIEIKTAGPWAAVYRQLARYAKDRMIKHLILVTTKADHPRTIPRDIGGKPVTVVLLRDGYGVVC